MVASSPVRHDSPLGVHPLEVQAYQPPWKALHDFAMHSDLEQPHPPAFQQLVNQVSESYPLNQNVSIRFDHVLHKNVFFQYKRLRKSGRHPVSYQFFYII